MRNEEKTMNAAKENKRSQEKNKEGKKRTWKRGKVYEMKGNWMETSVDGFQ